jgi:hypothetical protein
MEYVGRTVVNEERRKVVLRVRNSCHGGEIAGWKVGKEEDVWNKVKRSQYIRARGGINADGPAVVVVDVPRRYLYMGSTRVEG